MFEKFLSLCCCCVDPKLAHKPLDGFCSNLLKICILGYDTKSCFVQRLYQPQLFLKTPCFFQKFKFKTNLRIPCRETYLKIGVRGSKQNYYDRSNEYYDIRTIAIGSGVETRQCLKARCSKSYFFHSLPNLNLLTDFKEFCIIRLQAM